MRSRKIRKVVEILWFFIVDFFLGWLELRNSISCNDIFCILRNDFCKVIIYNRS